jgi:putative two-component system response regulator
MIAQEKTLMIVDDDKNLLFSLRHLFGKAGYQVITIPDGRGVLNRISSQKVDLVLCDAMMPPPNGFTIQKQLNSDPNTRSIPFIFLSALVSQQHITSCLQSGADDFITKPFDPDFLLARVASFLRRAELNQLKGKNESENLVVQLLGQKETAQADAIESLARALDLRDHNSGNHSFRVAELSVKLAQAWGIMEANNLSRIYNGALLHDVGKIAIPDKILRNPGPLSDNEQRIMRKHTTHAVDLLISYEAMHPIIDIPHFHHERWDGSGYPHGLVGSQIPIWAQIAGIADVWDALTHDRPYRSAMSFDEAKALLLSKNGAWFQPKLVDLLFHLVEKKGLES